MGLILSEKNIVACFLTSVHTDKRSRQTVRHGIFIVFPAPKAARRSTVTLPSFLISFPQYDFFFLRDTYSTGKAVDNSCLSDPLAVATLTEHIYQCLPLSSSCRPLSRKAERRRTFLDCAFQGPSSIVLVPILPGDRSLDAYMSVLTLTAALSHHAEAEVFFLLCSPSVMLLSCLSFGWYPE